MSKNKVSDPITHQEIAFACLVLSGAMTDRQAAVQQQLAQQEAEGLHCLNPSREQVLDRLWEIANLSPEMTRSSITGQVKAISIIVAIQNFIPDRRALAAEKKPAPAPTAQIYKAAWLREQQDTVTDAQPTPSKQEDSPRVAEPASTPSSAAETPSDPDPIQSTSDNSFTPSEAPEPDGPFASVPDLRFPFSINFNPLARRR